MSAPCWTSEKGGEEAVLCECPVKNSTWIDFATRAVVAEFNVYNANVELVSVASMLVEFMPSGDVRSVPKFTTNFPSEMELVDPSVPGMLPQGNGSRSNDPRRSMRTRTNAW